MSSDSPHTEQLLQELGWLRRVCRALVKDGGEAEDLAQDVWVEALRKPPQLRGKRLRGWLRVVAQRRMSATIRHRRLAQASRGGWAQDRVSGETVDGGSAVDRLDLHRRLMGAIDELPSPDREILVASYLEEKSAAVIGLRLGMKEASVRQRRVRALTKLRTQLGSKDERWSTWLPALAFCTPLLPVAPLGVGSSTKATTFHGASALSGPASLFLLSQAMLWKATALLLFVLGCALWMLNPPESASVPTALELAGDDLPDRIDPLSALDETGEREALGALEFIPAKSTVMAGVAPLTTPFVLVVDSDGAPVTKAKGLWIDDRRQVVALTFDERGRAERPSPSAGIAFLSAPGFLFAERPLGSSADLGPAVLTLQRERSFRLRLETVHGDEFQRVPSFSDQSAYPATSLVKLCGVGQISGLRRAHISEARQRRGRHVVFDGVLSVYQDVEGAGARLILPDTHKGVSVDSPLSLSVGGVELEVPESHFLQDEPTEKTLTLQRLPTLRGRSSWKHSGLPAVGSMTVMRRVLTNSQDRHVELPQPVTIGKDGSFEVAADFHDMFGLGIGFQGPSRELVFTLTDGASNAVYRQTLRSDDLPTGDEPLVLRWELPGVWRLDVVEERAGVPGDYLPVSGAAVIGAEDALTDANGQVEVDVVGDGSIWIYGPGHRPLIITSEDLRKHDAKKPLRAVLQRSPVLRVTVQPGMPTGALALRIESEEGIFGPPSAFGSGELTSAATMDTIWPSYSQLGVPFIKIGGRRPGSIVWFEAVEGAPQALPGLMQNRPLTVSLENELGQALDRHEIALGDDTEIQFPTSERVFGALGTVIIQARLRGTHTPAQGRVSVTRKDAARFLENGITRPLIGGRAVIGPILPGEYEVQLVIRLGSQDTEYVQTVQVGSGVTSMPLEF